MTIKSFRFEMKKFKTGDVVRLNSDTTDNIPMTVCCYYTDMINPAWVSETVLDTFGKIVFCQWRDTKNELQKENFHEDMLDFVHTV